MKYKVLRLKDDTWQVREISDEMEWDDIILKSPVAYQGSLADCEAYIHLTEQGLL